MCSAGELLKLALIPREKTNGAQKLKILSAGKSRVSISEVRTG